jgi:hypothetical protein
MNPVVFDGSDDAYLDWLVSHPDGYVINARRSLTPSYMVLHSAQCNSISTTKRIKGAYTERSYVKICSIELDVPRLWLRHHGRPDGMFSKECSSCCRNN